MNNKIWMVGNSQLHLSVIAEFCSEDDFSRLYQDWKSLRISEGKFLKDEHQINYLFCNMGLLGQISFDGENVSHTQNMSIFLNRIDRDASHIVIMLRGNEFAFESLVETPVPWDFSYNNSPAIKGRQLLKIKDVSTYLAKATNATLATCLLYKINFPKAKIWYVTPPPPIESKNHILSNPEGFKDLFEKFGVRPFSVRKKIYQVMYDSLSSSLDNFGIKTLRAPLESFTDTGGLREDFASGCLHGNHLYGRAIFELMEKEDFYAPL